MIRVSPTLSALAQKMASSNLEKTDTDLFYDGIVSHVRAVEDTFTENGVKFPDGTIQHTSFEGILGELKVARASAKGLKGPTRDSLIPITLSDIESEAIFMSFLGE